MYSCVLIDARWAGRVQTVLSNKANRALERAFVPQLNRALGQAFVPQLNRAFGQAFVRQLNRALEHAFIAAPCKNSKIPRRRLQRPGIAPPYNKVTWDTPAIPIPGVDRRLAEEHPSSSPRAAAQPAIREVWGGVVFELDYPARA